VAYDEELADRIRELLGGEADLTERRCSAGSLFCARAVAVTPLSGVGLLDLREKVPQVFGNGALGQPEGEHESKESAFETSEVADRNHVHLAATVRARGMDLPRAPRLKMFESMTVPLTDPAFDQFVDACSRVLGSGLAEHADARFMADADSALISCVQALPDGLHRRD
jgi:hypothetical protein